MDTDFSLKERVEKMNIVIKKSGNTNDNDKRKVTYAEVLSRNIGEDGEIIREENSTG